MSLSLFLLDVAVKSFAVMFVVTLIAWSCQRKSAAFRHRVWSWGVCGTLAIPLISYVGPAWRVAILPSERVATPVATPALSPGEHVSQPSGDFVSNRVANADSIIRSPNRPLEPSESMKPDAPMMADMPAPSSPLMETGFPEAKARSWLPSPETLSVFWAIGTLVLLAGQARRWLLTMRWVRRARCVPEERRNAMLGGVSVRLLHGDDVSMPCAVGVVRPAVLLPTAALSWSLDRLEAVLLHELAHVARRDVLMQSLAELCRSLYWFNPLVWLAASRLRLEREQACDDHVLAAGVRGSDYAQVLLHVARGYRDEHRDLGLAMARPKDLQRRIGSVLDNTRSHLPLGRRSACTLFASLMLVSVGAALLRPVSVAGETPLEPGDPPSVSQVTGVDSWLRGSNTNLQMRLWGEVLDSAGHSVSNATLTLVLVSHEGDFAVQPKLDGSRFEFWIPMDYRNWMSLKLECFLPGANERAAFLLVRHDLRELAMKGMTINLRKPVKTARVIVRHGEQPVSGAHAKAEIEGGRVFRGTTDAAGSVSVDLYANEQLSSFTAWTEDHRIGGYQFHRQPVRDRDGLSHVIELYQCRDQNIRIVDGDGKGIEGVEFRVEVATPAPYFNYLGVVNDATLTSNDRGEAVFRWFPDWAEVHHYVALQDNQYFIREQGNSADGTLVVTLQRRSSQRTRVMGEVLGPKQDLAGLSVYATSFQAEREGHGDPLRATTDGGGRFWVDVLPGSTYCWHVADPKLVSDYFTGVAFDPVTGKVGSPKLTLQQSVIATVRLTQGSERAPVVNEFVSFGNDHIFEWIEDGKTRRGSAGAHIRSTTDELGVATAVVLPGAVEVSVYQPDWRGSGVIEANHDGVNHLELHREIVRARRVTGRIVVSENSKTSLVNVKPMSGELIVGAIDGGTQDHRTVPISVDGSFEFETSATKLGLCAFTKNRGAAGVMIARDLSRPIIVKLLPTAALRGKLIDADGKAVAGRRLTASVRVKDDTAATSGSGIFGATAGLGPEFRVSATTRADGTCEIEGLPRFAAIGVFAEGQALPIDQVFLEPDEDRPVAIWRLMPETPRTTPSQTIMQRWTEIQRDCRLNGYNTLVVATDPSAEAKSFVAEHLTDGESNPDAAKFISLAYQQGPTDASFTHNMRWPPPRAGEVTAIAYNPMGEELGRRTFMLGDEESPELAATFLRIHRPKAIDATTAWNKAFSVAKQSDRRVWVRIGSRYCAPCFRFSRWLDDQKDLLERDFVMLKLNRTDQPDLLNKLTEGKNLGVPFHAIFDADGNKIIDSQGPLGNIGSPTGFEGRRHLQRMLKAGRQRLTEAEIQQLSSSVPH